MSNDINININNNISNNLCNCTDVTDVAKEARIGRCVILFLR